MLAVPSEFMPLREIKMDKCLVTGVAGFHWVTLFIETKEYLSSNQKDTVSLIEQWPYPRHGENGYSGRSSR